MKQIDAVYMAIAELGDKTDIKVLAKRASQICEKVIVYNTAMRCRLRWRKEVGLNTDARTHRDIPRRNMLNDQIVTSDHLKRLFHFLSSTGVKPDDLITMIGSGKTKFHSLDQLEIAAKDISELHTMFQPK